MQQNHEKLLSKLRAGNVYRREDLIGYSKAIDRDLNKLTEKGLLEKVSPGLYYKPMESRFGLLPPDDNVLVKSFLNDKHFLVFSKNDYNVLNVGLTQLYHHNIVYNKKRHGSFKLAGREFEFRRPNNGFPSKLTYEFLIVDLLNHLTELVDEDTAAIKENVKEMLSEELLHKVRLCANKYGKVGTKKFLNGIK